MRSPLRQINDDGGIPPPVAIQTKVIDGKHVVCLADPANVSPKDRPINPFEARGLNLDLSAVPQDLYCPSAQGHISNRTCPVCKMYFPSVAQMLQHRRKLHPRTRYKLDDLYEQGIVVDAVGEPVRVLNELGDGFYRVLFSSGVFMVSFCICVP